MLDLRYYQTPTVEYILNAIDFGPRVFNVQAPTGAGKTIMMGKCLAERPGQLLLTHRKILFDQTAGVLTRLGVPHGLRAAGYKMDSAAPIQIAMTQTELSRTFRKKTVPMHDCVAVHVDEIHAQAGETTQYMLEQYRKQGASIVTWSATPSDIANIVTENYVSATVSELIDAGYLVKPVVFGPDIPDMEKVSNIKRAANGDLDATELDRIWNVKVIFGSVLRNLQLINPELRPSILFAQGVPHSLFFAQRLTAMGVRSAHIDGANVWLDGKTYKSDRAMRERVFEESKSGKIKVICNRFVMREGADLPWLSHVIDACVFGTRKAWVQSNGRGLRPYPGKDQCTIQDHGGNWLLHSALDSDDPWDLGQSDRISAQIRIDNMREGKLPEPINCQKCNAIRACGDSCPVCGFRSERRIKPVLQLNGELRLQDGPAYRKREISPVKGADRDWSRLYWGSRKHNPKRTFNQLYSYYAYKNNWKWLPRDLPLMPVNVEDWYACVGDVPQTKLFC